MRMIIFDLDGTLLNTLADIGNACNSVLEKHDLPAHSMEKYRQMVGNGFDKLMERALGSRPENFADLVQEAREYYANHMMIDTAPYEGIMDTLHGLVAKNVGLCVVSNKPDALSVKLIANYFSDIPFKYVYGAKDGVPLKPDPILVRKVMRDSGMKEDEACYCGDSDVDVLTAHNANIPCLGAGWGFRGSEELIRAGVDRILTTPAQLLELAG